MQIGKGQTAALNSEGNIEITKNDCSIAQYDKNGRLYREYVVNDDNSTSDIYYSYAKNGKLIQTQETIHYPNGNYTYIFKNGNNELVEMQKVIFENNNKTTTYDTTFGNSTRNVHKYTDTENGYVSSNIRYDADNNIISITNSEYDNKYLNGTSVTYNADKSKILERTVEEFNPETNIQTITTYDGNNM